MSEAQAADAPLTVDAAIGLLNAEVPPEENDAPAAPDEEIEAEPPAEDELDPEEVIEPEEEAPEETEEVIPPPKSWSAKDKDAWEAIPVEAKAVIMARETERDVSTQKAVQEAVEARKRADGEVQNVTQIKAALDQILPQAIQTFRGKWADWTPQAQVELARSNAAEYNIRRAEFEAEQAQMVQLQAVNQQAQAVAFETFVRTESAKLAELSPELADPVKGPSRKTELVTYLTEKLGVPKEVIPTLDANTVALAYDGMRYRQAKAGLAKPDKPVPARPVRPTAAAPVASSQRTAEAARNRFAQTHSIEDALAMMNAKG